VSIKLSEKSTEAPAKLVGISLEARGVVVFDFLLVIL
jgi:hypothetical protein